jgi:hypothetical protein
VAAGKQGVDDVAADEAGTAGDEDFHGINGQFAWETRECRGPTHGGLRRPDDSRWPRGRTPGRRPAVDSRSGPRNRRRF